MKRDQRINGYVVVNAPTNTYRGVDRDPWGIVGDHYYSNVLPQGIRALYEDMDRDRGYWWRSTPSINAAKDALAYSRKFDEGAELLAIYSPYLDSLGVTPWADTVSDSIGYDVVGVGEWSLLSAFHSSSVCIPDHISINEGGLLDEPALMDSIVDAYRVHAGVNELEPLAPEADGLPIEAVRVFLYSQPTS